MPLTDLITRWRVVRNTVVSCRVPLAKSIGDCCEGGGGGPFPPLRDHQLRTAWPNLLMLALSSAPDSRPAAVWCVGSYGESHDSEAGIFKDFGQCPEFPVRSKPQV